MLDDSTGVAMMRPRLPRRLRTWLATPYVAAITSAGAVAAMGVLGVLVVAAIGSPSPTDLRTLTCTVAQHTESMTEDGTDYWMDTVECGQIVSDETFYGKLLAGHRYRISVGDGKSHIGIPTGTHLVAVLDELPITPEEVEAAVEHGRDLQSQWLAKIAVGGLILLVIGVILAVVDVYSDRQASRRRRREQ